MDELIEQFVIEARELVQQASEDLLALESSPQDRTRLESAFRAVHTLKGSVGLFDFGPMQDVLHRAEDLLSGARASETEVDAALIDPLIAVIDWVDNCVDWISRNGQLSDAQRQQAGRLLGLLTRAAVEDDGAIVSPAATPAAKPDWASALETRLRAAGITGSLVLIRYQPHAECFFNGDDPFATMARLTDLKHMDFALREPVADTSEYDPFRCNLVIHAAAGGGAAEVAAVFRLIPDQVELVTVADTASDQPATTMQDRAERTSTVMRVESARIDALVAIAGELVTAKNGLEPLAEEARGKGDDQLARRISASHHEIERLVASLYSAVTRARMIPLESTFRRFPRLVRETSARLGKAVDLVIEGENVEADREIVESLFDPLLHLIRNALDHGIEPEAERLAQAKPARGLVRLRAHQKGDRVEIDISDDGHGMDPARVGRKAVERGLISQERLQTLSSEDILQLVFAPGFSTASAVSDLSGRGVGLDVVQSTVTKLGGSVELKSTVGRGTSFVLRLPISFSMTELMVVETAGERFGIPIVDILETHRLSRAAIQPVRAGHAFILRDRTLPLLRLCDLLKLQDNGTSGDDLTVLIVTVGGERIGIAVDAIAERTETLTRPFAGLLQGVAGMAGTTLMGDGRVLLVLNLEELVA